MCDNLIIYNKFREVPREAKREITAGRTKGFTDINPMWRIKKLTEEFGPCGFGWYYTPTRRWIEQVGNEYVAFVDIEMRVRIGEEWSMPISGTGGSKLATKEKAGIYVSDECYKMATTDAISVSCKQLGIGADVYFEQDVTKYASDTSRKISDSEKGYLQQAAERTGMALEKAIKQRGGKSIEDVTYAAYVKWMIALANTDSVIPKAPTGVPEPDKSVENVPFK